MPKTPKAKDTQADNKADSATKPTRARARKTPAAKAAQPGEQTKKRQQRSTGPVTTHWRKDWQDHMITEIAGGKSLYAITAPDDMPSYAAVMRHVDADADLRERYVRARVDSADADADQIKAISEQVTAGTLDPNAARVAIDALKWSAGKRQPSKYGEKQTIDLNATIENKDDKELLHELERSAGVLGLSVADLVSGITGKSPSDQRESKETRH